MKIENLQLRNWPRRFYDWVVHWAQTPFGLPALIVLAILEPICVPIPADVMVVGLSLGNPKKGIHYGLTCAVFSVLGGTTALLLGLAIGPERVVQFFDWVSVGPLHLGAKAQKALELYQRYDFWAVAISALTPVPYLLFSWLGGMANISILKFIWVSLIFRTLRFGSEGVLFYFFGTKAKDWIDKHFNTATIIVMVGLIILVWVLRTAQSFF